MCAKTAVALPERDAMGLVDGGIRLVPIATNAPEPQISPDQNAAPVEPQPPAAGSLDEGGPGRGGRVSSAGECAERPATLQDGST